MKRISVICTVVFLLFSALSAFSAGDQPLFPLESMIDKSGKVWATTSDDFMKKHRVLGFRWLSASSKDRAREYQGPVSFLDMRVLETIASFEEGRLKELSLSLYNRGDGGDMSERDFLELVAKAEKKLNEWTGVRSVKVDVALITSAVKKEARAWVKKPNQFKLEWSWTRGSHNKGFDYRAEYIRLLCGKFETTSDYRSSQLARKTTRGGMVSMSALKANVTKKNGGDVFIDGIPMVNQGDKGYCVVANTERIMRYYGREVDQHELAQMALSDAQAGTSGKLMIDVLRKLGLALGCKIKVHEELKLNDFQKTVKDYNRAAKKKNQQEIIMPTRGIIDVAEISGQMETEILRETRQKLKADFNKFMANVKSYVNRGIPLVWSVEVGRVEEKPPVTGTGGHMRMIVGYNTKKKEVLYSDTWGAGHECKRMSSDDAWLITKGLYTVEPTKKTL